MTQGGGGGSGRGWRLAPGALLNNTYRIERPIAAGGMGEVYLASNIHNRSERVAIKTILANDHEARETLEALFGREADALTRVFHANVVGYRGFSRDAVLDVHYIVTQFIDGPTLGSMMGRHAFSARDLIGLMRGLAAGLAAAHREGVVHRDLKPDNVLLEGGDLARPKIIDFGIVKDMDTELSTIVAGSFAGTLSYATPEQLGKPVHPAGPWTDVYALGLTALALAQGHKVDMGRSLADAIERRGRVPDLSGAPPALQPLLRAMLQPHPRSRPQSMGDVLEGLAAAEAELDGRGPRRAVRRRIVAVSAVALCMAGLVAASPLLRGALGAHDPDPVFTAPANEATEAVAEETAALEQPTEAVTQPLPTTAPKPTTPASPLPEWQLEPDEEVGIPADDPPAQIDQEWLDRVLKKP
jgi:serine/threonine protein kinase